MSAQAQNIQHMDVFVRDYFEHSITVNGSDTVISINSFKEPQMFVVLTDTNNITGFTVKLGTTSGGNDIIEKTFTYATEGEFLDGTSYIRDGVYIRLYLGKYATLGNYYAQVQATVGGNVQTAVTFEGQ